MMILIMNNYELRSDSSSLVFATRNVAIRWDDQGCPLIDFASFSQVCSAVIEYLLFGLDKTEYKVYKYWIFRVQVIQVWFTMPCNILPSTLKSGWELRLVFSVPRATLEMVIYIYTWTLISQIFQKADNCRHVLSCFNLTTI